MTADLDTLRAQLAAERAAREAADGYARYCADRLEWMTSRVREIHTALTWYGEGNQDGGEIARAALVSDPAPYPCAHEAKLAEVTRELDELRARLEMAVERTTLALKWRDAAERRACALREALVDVLAAADADSDTPRDDCCGAWDCPESHGLDRPGPCAWCRARAALTADPARCPHEEEAKRWRDATTRVVNAVHDRVTEADDSAASLADEDPAAARHYDELGEWTLALLTRIRTFIPKEMP